MIQVSQRRAEIALYITYGMKKQFLFGRSGMQALGYWPTGRSLAEQEHEERKSLPDVEEEIQ